MMKRIFLITHFFIFTLSVNAQNAAKYFDDYLIICKEENISNCFLEKNNYVRLEIYDHFDSIQRYISPFNLQEASVQDLEDIKKTYNLIDSVYSDYWLITFFSGNSLSYDWVSFYFQFEEAIRYLNLKFSDTSIAFDSLKNMIQGIQNQDEKVVKKYLEGIYNEKIFKDKGLFYLPSIATYQYYFIHNIELFKDEIALEMRNFIPTGEKTIEEKMFYTWRNILWKAQKIDLLREIITEKKEAFKEVGRSNDWELLIKWLR